MQVVCCCDLVGVKCSDSS